MKRTLSLVLALVMILGTIPAFAAAPTVNEAAEFLNSEEVNVLRGNLSEGALMLEEGLKRQDSVVMLSRLLGEEDVVEATEGEPTWEDIADGFYNPVLKWAQETGWYNGHSEVRFGYNEVITAQDYSLVLLRALGYVDELEVAWADAYEKAIELGLLEDIGEKAEITRGEMAVMTFIALGTEMADGEQTLAEALEIEMPEEVKELEMTVEVINAKTIEVTFNQEVDKEEAVVELLRGTFKQNVTLTWAEDNESVQLVGAGNFQAADYTVNVTVDEEVLTASFKIEAQKVTSIELLSDVAVLSANPTTGLITTETATVGYIVKDQYGTDITANTQLTTNSSTVVVDNKGKVTLSGLNNMRIGDSVPVVLVHALSGTTTTGVVKLSAAATVSNIEFEGIYNAKGEVVELTDAVDASTVFLVVNLKDQYGNNIAAGNVGTDATGVIVTNTNPLTLKLVNDKVTSVSIANKNRFAIKFVELDATNEFKAGSAELLLITTMNGGTFRHTVNVTETKTTDVVSVGQPEYVIKGEKVLLPITVLDRDGNVITDKKVLAHPTKGIKINQLPLDETKLSEKDGQMYYNLENPVGAAGSYETATITSSTFKIATVTYRIAEQAKPVSIRGLKNPLILKVGAAPKTLVFADVNVEDQYGRTMTATTWGNAGSNYSIQVKDVASGAVTVSGSVITAGASNGTANIIIYLKDTALVSGTNALGEVANSAVQQQVRVTDGKEYTGYEIATIGKVQAADVQTAGAKAFTVNGILNGGKVKLDSNEFTVAISGGKNTATATPGAITVNKGDLTVSAGVEIDTEFTLKVTINATGTVIEQKFIVSADNKVVEDFFFTTDSVYASAKAITEAELATGSAITSGLKVGANVVKIATTDQYGNKTVEALDPAKVKVVIVPEKVAEVNITGNGTATAAATLASDVTEANVTIKLTIGNATKEIKAVVK